MRSGSKHPSAQTPSLAKRLSRRQALKAMSVTGVVLASGQSLRCGGAAPVTRDVQPGRPGPTPGPLAEGTAPRNFTAEDFAVLGALAESIIPATDTPSARDAGVHWFLDDVAGHQATMKQQFQTGLKRLDELARGAHGKGFAELSTGERAGVLTSISDAAVKPGEKPSPDQTFFSFAKSQIVSNYYRSDIGLRIELEWVGREFHTKFPGACPHPDPLVHPRTRWQSRT